MFGDPKNPNSLHAFGYGGANPLRFTDPDGRTVCTPGDPGSCAQAAEEMEDLVQGCAREPGRDEETCRREFAKAELKGATVGIVAAGCFFQPELCIGGALTGFGFDAARQGVKQVETGRPGFNWGEAAVATGTGAALGPMSRVPGVKQVLIWGGGALGVTSAYDEAKHGNTATALFDLAFATLPVAAEYGPKLPDFSLPKPPLVRVAATPSGGTVVVAGEEAPAASRPPSVFEARAKGAGAQADAPEHHLMTNKNRVSKARGGPWTQKFEDMAKRAGMTLDDVENKIRIKGHRGPHPKEYHQQLFDRLSGVTEGLDGEDYAAAFRAELEAIKQEAATPGSPLNRLLTGK